MTQGTFREEIDGYSFTFMPIECIDEGAPIETEFTVTTDWGTYTMRENPDTVAFVFTDPKNVPQEFIELEERLSDLIYGHEE